jgi:autoinducer 2-degrading protein|tara:strand:+ start:177 stop:515 length:339 start_codon:yes stop_codon:yes gene_type:complete
MYAIFVTVNVHPEHVDAFIAAGPGDAEGSVRDEPGCFRFDIMQDQEIPHRFYLYEVYADEAAFQAHLETPHFLEWKSTVEEMFAGELEITAMRTLFPSDDGWREQKPALLNW